MSTRPRGEKIDSMKEHSLAIITGKKFHFCHHFNGIGKLVITRKSISENSFICSILNYHIFHREPII